MSNYAWWLESQLEPDAKPTAPNLARGTYEPNRRRITNAEAELWWEEEKNRQALSGYTEHEIKTAGE